MLQHSRFARRATVLASAAFAASVAGCSAGDVELNGKVFDAMGMTAGKQSGKDPKMAARAPIVLPPSLDKLPEPGEATETASIPEVKDADEQKVVRKAELEREHAEYCKVHYEQAKQRGDVAGAEVAKGPLGECRPSIFTSLDKWNKSE
jgi:hypothetical protein